MDKVVLKIAGLIAIVIGIFLCITIIGLIFGVINIVGGMKFIELSNSDDDVIIEQKNAIMYWSIYFIFTTIASGILGLLYYSSLNDKFKSEEINLNNKSNLENQLEELNRLKEKGLITEEEYKKKRKKILDI